MHTTKAATTSDDEAACCAARGSRSRTDAASLAVRVYCEMPRNGGENGAGAFLNHPRPEPARTLRPAERGSRFAFAPLLSGFCGMHAG
jgi:hypothetical protein